MGGTALLEFRLCKRLRIVANMNVVYDIWNALCKETCLFFMMNTNKKKRKKKDGSKMRRMLHCLGIHCWMLLALQRITGYVCICVCVCCGESSIQQLYWQEAVPTFLQQMFDRKYFHSCRGKSGKMYMVHKSHWMWWKLRKKTSTCMIFYYTGISIR